jgi:hypothetical protein
MKALLMISITLLAGSLMLIAPQFMAALILTMMALGPLSTMEVGR